MRKRTFTFIVLAYAASIMGCGSETVVGPPPAQPPPDPSVLSRISIKPAEIALLPRMTIALTLVAVDQHGRALTWTADAVTYSSSNPAIATVDNRGIVTGISAGAAVVSATLTLNGHASRALVNFDVVELRPGKYELTAPVTESGWGISGRYTALLTLWQDSSLTSNAGSLTGTFEGLRLVGPDGEIEQSAPGGIVKIGLDGLGRLRVQLIVGEIVWWEGILFSADQDSFRGTYALGDGWAAGPFTAKWLGD